MSGGHRTNVVVILVFSAPTPVQQLCVVWVLHFYLTTVDRGAVQAENYIAMLEDSLHR